MLDRIRVDTELTVRRRSTVSEQPRAELAMQDPAPWRRRHVTMDRPIDLRHDRTAPDARFVETHGSRSNVCDGRRLCELVVQRERMRHAVADRGRAFACQS